MRRPDPSSPRLPGFGLSKPSPGAECRGEDSNLCCVAEHHLHVGDPLRDREGYVYFVQPWLEPTAPIKIDLAGLRAVREVERVLEPLRGADHTRAYELAVAGEQPSPRRSGGKPAKETERSAAPC